MIEQIEPRLRLVDEDGAIAEPAPKTPKYALAGQQADEHRERQPDGSHVLGTLCHRIDDQLQAVLRSAGGRRRSQDRGEGGEMQKRPPSDIVPEKRNRSARKCGDTAQARAFGRSRASKLRGSG